MSLNRRSVFAISAILLFYTLASVNSDVAAEVPIGQPLIVEINLPLSFVGSAINGTTNLPDGTKLMATFERDVSTCQSNCEYLLGSPLDIENGNFVIKTLPAKPGPYKLEITSSIAELNSPEVRAVIGQYGENMRGPYIKPEIIHGAGPTVEYRADIVIPTNGGPNASAPPATYASSNDEVRAFQERQAEQIKAYNKASVWKKIVADNGAVYQIDVGHIQHYNTGAAEIPVYTDEGGAYNPSNLTSLFFDCQGHYQDQANFGVTLYAAPNSIAGQIQTIACNRGD